jgi:hypothetical protein
MRHLLFKSVIPLLAFLSTVSSPIYGLNEIFELYNPPQVVAMGGAITADASGYLSNYYNPAGLAKAPAKKWEITPIDFESILTAASIARVYQGGGFGLNRLFIPMQNNPGKYTYFDLASVPSVSTKNLSISFLANYEYAGLSDGTNLDVYSHVDLGPTVGVSTSLFGNRLKVGVAGKVLLRNELNGNFPLSSFTSAAATSALEKEGIGAGADFGAILQIPTTYLPSIGVVWKDALVGTQFIPVHILNPLASGAPEAIPQSINAGVSIHPILARGVQLTAAVDIQHLEWNDLPITKRLHVGLQLQSAKSLFLWVGANQLLLTGGLGYRLPGGTLEIATYGVDVGDSTTIIQDRRYIFRYTINL